jgi:hypothetical protein
MFLGRGTSFNETWRYSVRGARVRAAMNVPLAERSVGFSDGHEHSHHRRRLEKLAPIHLHLRRTQREYVAAARGIASLSPDVSG